jgi:(R)-2-hydroxyacyl-CoA dehydratese activating ATPase
VRTGYDFRKAARIVIDRLSSRHVIAGPVCTCGYGREQIEVPFAPCSEVVALSRAVYERLGRPVAVLDIGGQDTKFVEVAADGSIARFKLNRKCAAGTGSFLEEMAFRLDVEAAEFGALAREATSPVEINSFCTVFAGSEIIGMLRDGVPLPDIVMGLYRSVVRRALELSASTCDLFLTGGVAARHPIIVELLAEQLGSVTSCDGAQFLAAYGSVLEVTSA